MKLTHPKRALLSVSDKAGLIPLARALRDSGCELYASGGTKAAIDAEGIEVLPVERLSRSPEAFSGRMKTLAFPVFGGILARRGNPSDDADRAKLGISLIDVVVVNFYPFEKSIGSTTAGELTELIDIGGPALVRAAAKNCESVLVLSDPSLYGAAITDLKKLNGIQEITRITGAAQAWRDVARYDQAITDTFASHELRYGENPHQSAKFELHADSPIAWNEPCTESALSYNNILDFSAGFRLLSDLCNWNPTAAHVVVIKHQNPCGVATHIGGSLETALNTAWACDPVSAFGGIVLLSKPLDKAASSFLQTHFIEGLAAPSLSRESAELKNLSLKRKNLKAVSITNLIFQEGFTEITVPGGKLKQAADSYATEPLEVKCGETWNDDQTSLAQFGILAAKSLKSNAIAVVDSPRRGEFRLLGAGQGQPNRIEAITKLAVPRARAILESEARENLDERLGQAVLVSDAFFPFSDSIDAIAAAGIKRIVEPGGSIRDEEVIARARELEVDLVFSRKRHFRH